MFISKYKKRTPFFGKNAPPFRGLEIKEEKNSTFLDQTESTATQNREHK